MLKLGQPDGLVGLGAINDEVVVGSIACLDARGTAPAGNKNDGDVDQHFP
jgi:hypothetical protein